jgi:thymidine kinase
MFHQKIGRQIIYNTDCLSILDEIKNIDVIVTSPPYNIGVKYSNYNDKLTTHNFDTVECFTFLELKDIPTNLLLTYHTIIVDEGQFFPDLKETVINWLNNLSINIIIGGLDGDFNKEPIGSILELIPHADKCTKLNSLCNICKDGTEAPFSLRLVASKDKILVGGSESYIPVCRKHYSP